MNDGAPLTAEVASDSRRQAELNRTITPVSGRGDRAFGKTIAFAGLALGCAVFAIVTWRQEHARPRPPPKRPAQQIVPFEAVRAEPSPQMDATLAAATPTHESSESPAPISARERSAASAIPAPDRAPPPAPPPMLAFSRPAPHTSRPAPQFTAPAARAETELEQLRRGSGIGIVSATRLVDRDLMLVAGTIVPCVLETALDSSTPGHVTCLVARDIYSATGAVVLLEKGSRVLGEYRAGMRQGQRRLFVLWNRALTPAGVAVQLSSPASDPLGRAGFDGDLDTHFWDRFGGALVLSVLDLGVAEIGSDQYGRLVREPSAAAAVAVQGSVDIPASLRKRHGEEVAIFTAVDLDFAPVYRLKAR